MTNPFRNKGFDAFRLCFVPHKFEKNIFIRVKKHKEKKKLKIYLKLLNTFDMLLLIFSLI